MNIQTYFQSLNTDQRREIANKAGIGYDYFYQLSTGYRTPSPKVALALERATDGLLAKELLRPDIWGEAA